MKELITVFIGSGLGGMTRFGLGKWINSWHKTNFPLGTFSVNVIACLVLGIIIGLADYKQLISPQAKLFWMVGFCGGFSTFSAFSNEALTLLNTGLHLTSLMYIFLSIFLCILSVYFGIWIINKI
jgi:CrcB protein